MSTLAAYHYSPLPSPHHIRLLELSRYSDRGDPLTGTMRVINIVDHDDVDDEEILPYVALSYRWTEDRSEQLLLDDNEIIRISKDLDAALRRFRYASALRWIWVDAICINQQDNAEKSIQIPLMTHIYRGASRVMIWLGNRAEDADLLRRVKSLIKDTKENSEVFGPYLGTQATKVAQTLITNLNLSMSQLGRLGWFTRRWILQELALNATPVLCCGQVELPWTQLAGVFGYSKSHDACQRNYQHSDRLLLWNQEDPGLWNIQLLWDLWWTTAISPMPHSKNSLELDDRDIAALMDAYSDFECSESRDQIAALFGLSRDTQGPAAFRVDYADSVEQTYVKSAESLVRAGHLAWLLYHRFRREKERGSRPTTLPSWVPDWRIRIWARTRRAHSKYTKTAASRIQDSNNNDGVHLLTTNFWLTPFLRILWKSSSFPEGTGLRDRVVLVLVDLWTFIVAHLSEGTNSRRQMWDELLLQILPVFTRRAYSGRDLRPVLGDEYQTFGDEDLNDLEVLRRYIISRTSCLPQDRFVSEPLAECLVFCQQPSDCLSSGSICGLGSVPPSFCSQVAVGDKVLMADLGHFGNTEDTNLDVRLQWSRYIVREQCEAPEDFVDSVADRLGGKEPSSTHGTNACYKSGLNSKLVSPWVYEFVAPCPTFKPFRWPALMHNRTRQKPQRHSIYLERAWAEGTENEKGSIWIR